MKIKKLGILEELKVFSIEIILELEDFLIPKIVVDYIFFIKWLQTNFFWINR